MPRPPKTDSPSARYKEDQSRLQDLESKLDIIVSKLLNDPTNAELNSERLRIEAKIVAITGEDAIYSNNDLR